MDYFSLLGLDREPFSNSPDPAFFYAAGPQLACLQQLELSIRLKRGLSVVMGPVGTGKTTISRELVRRLGKDVSVRVHLVLDPSYATGGDFLRGMEEMLAGQSGGSLPDWQRKERIKNLLFELGVANDTTVVLLIDEGQKLSVECLEVLREFLNYETNTHKLLQVAIFAQEEFGSTLDSLENFRDRISCFLRLGPMNFWDMRAMVKYRIERSNDTDRPVGFSLPAMWLVYRLTRGYPRKVVHLCHRILLNVIVQGKRRVAYRNVSAAARTVPTGRKIPLKAVGIILVLCVAMASGLGLYGATGKFPWSVSRSPADKESGHPQTAGGSASVPQDSPPPPVHHYVLHGSANSSRVKKGAAAEERRAPAPDTPQHSLGSGTKPSQVRNPGHNPLKMVTEVPQTLGYLRAGRDSTLFSMIRVVYGARTSQEIEPYLREILRRNPSFRNPDVLEVGTRLAFPTPAETDPPGPGRSFWILVKETGSLQRAYDWAIRCCERYSHRNVTQSPFLLTMVLSWNGDSGFTFGLVVNTSYGSMQAAGESSGFIRARAWGEPVVIGRDHFKGRTLYSTLP
ncbi:ExeA family protein [Desulfoplanes sp.]